MNNKPVYPKDNGSLERARQLFYKKVREWRWDEPEECTYKRRGRKPKPYIKYESKPRSASERMAMEHGKEKQQAFKQSKYNWL
jgi:hypothetical protein